MRREGERENASASVSFRVIGAEGLRKFKALQKAYAMVILPPGFFMSVESQVGTQVK